MEGGEGVALVIILCRLTDDLKNHRADGLRSLHIHLIIRLNCGTSWEPRDELMNAEMCVGCYF